MTPASPHPAPPRAGAAPSAAATPAPGTEPSPAREDPSFAGSLAALLGYARPQRARLLGACALMLVSGAIGLAQPLVVRRVLSEMTPHRLAGADILALVALVVVGAGITALGQYQLTVAAEGVVRAARLRLTRHMLRLPLAVFRRTAPGDLLARVTGDTSLLRQVVLQTLVQAVTGLIVVIGALTLMACLDLVLLAVSAAVIVLLLGVVGLVMPRIRQASFDSQTAVGDMGGVLERALNAFTTVKAFGAEEYEADRVAVSVDGAYRHGLRRARWDAATGTVASLSVQVIFLAVLGVGGYRVGTGAISVGTLVAFLLYVLFLAEPVLGLVAVGSTFQTARAALMRVGAVTALPVEPDPAPEPAAPAGPSRAAACLVFDRVGFTYPGKTAPALRAFSLEVPAVGLTALVGPSGAGKTTVLGLIERFYEPGAGSVSFDGRDLRDWDRHRLRAAIGYVEQDSPVMAGTLRENLAYPGRDHTDDDLREVLATTRLLPLLDRLGGDLDAPVGHRGVTLSGGERQRVAIARALLRRPRLLLLDEATSQLDAVNEAALREVVRDLSTRCAVLAVAHRLSTVRAAARIAVVQDGRVRETGTHDELLGRSELYATLAAHQLVSA